MASYCKGKRLEVLEKKYELLKEENEDYRKRIQINEVTIDNLNKLIRTLFKKVCCGAKSYLDEQLKKLQINKESNSKINENIIYENKENINEDKIPYEKPENFKKNNSNQPLGEQQKINTEVKKEDKKEENKEDKEKKNKENKKEKNKEEKNKKEHPKIVGYKG